MNLEKIKNANTIYLGKEIIYEDEMVSTQDFAKELAKENGKNGTIVITDNQTKGRGTNGRSWIVSKGKNITMTILLKPDLKVSKLEGLTLKIAEVIKDSIKELYDYNLTIKEPNDLLLNGKKICGILTESSSYNDKVNYILIGIGFDVNEENFNKELRKHCNFIKKRVWKRI